MSILKKIFGTSYEENWKQFAEEINGQYVEKGILKGNKVEARHKNWTITIDIKDVGSDAASLFTRFRAPFVSKNNFRFEIYQMSLPFSLLSGIFSSETIKTGYKEIDKDFKVRSNDEKKVREFLSNSEIRQIIVSQSNYHFSIVDDEGFFGTTFPKDVDELYFYTSGVIREVEHMKSIYRLFTESLNQLSQMDLADAKDPQVVL